MHFNIPEGIRKRFTDKCRKVFNDCEKEISENEESLAEDRLELRNKFYTIIGGVIFNMHVNKRIVFNREFRRLEKQYNNSNK